MVGNLKDSNKQLEQAILLREFYNIPLKYKTHPKLMSRMGKKIAMKKKNDVEKNFNVGQIYYFLYGLGPITFKNYESSYFMRTYPLLFQKRIYLLSLDLVRNYHRLPFSQRTVFAL